MANQHRAIRSAACASRTEQFLIWAMRLWWRAFPELDLAWGDLVIGFRHCGVPAAIESCHRFCSIALVAADRAGGIGCLHCPFISRAEEDLLEALSLASCGDVEAAEIPLRRLMSARAARHAAPHAVRF